MEADGVFVRYSYICSALLTKLTNFFLAYSISKV